MNPYREPSEFTEANPAIEEMLKRERAKEIMKDDYFGPEAVKTVFGIEVLDSEIPSLPYTLEQLEQAKELGEILILRVSHDNSGRPMTMEQINEIMQPRMKSKIFCDYRPGEGDWFKSEDFYKKDFIKTEWKLVSRSFLPDVTSKKNKEGKYVNGSRGCGYAYQTKILREWLKSIDFLEKDEESECSDKILLELSEEVGLKFGSSAIKDYSKRWPAKKEKKFCRKIVNLKINVRHRQSPTEILYDWMLGFSTRGGLSVSDAEIAGSIESRLKYYGLFGDERSRVLSRSLSSRGRVVGVHFCFSYLGGRMYIFDSYASIGEWEEGLISQR